MTAKTINLSDKRHILFFVSGLLIVGFVASSLVSYYTTAKMYQKELSESILPLTGDNIYSNVQKDIVELVLISSLMANDTFLIDWTLSGEKDASRMTKYLKTIQSKYHTVTSFFVSDNTLAYYHPKGIFTVLEKGSPRDKWYFKLKHLEDEYEINLGIDDANKGALTIFVNYKMFDFEGQFLGVTGCGLTVNNVQALLDMYAKKYNRIIYFVDQQGRVTLANRIAPPSFKNIDQVQQLQGLGLDPKHLTSSSVSYQRNNEAFLLNTRYIPELKLYLFVEQSLKNTDQHNLILLLLKNFFITLAMGGVIIGAVFVTVNRYQKELESLASTDKLTQLNNRHSFELLMGQALKQAIRENLALTIFIFDIDHFKKINDRYGHPAGDAVLQQLSSLVRKSLRTSDIVCRWGGEEFLVLLENCTIDKGADIAEQLRQAVEQTSFCYEDMTICVSISIGVTQWQPNEEKGELIKRADQALYRAKESGRNRVEIS